MAKNLPEQIKKEKYQFPEYSKEELKELGKEMESYKITKTLSDGKIVTLYDEDKWYKDNGGLNKFGDIIVTGFCEKTNWTANPPYNYSFCDYPSQYLILQDKLWKMYKLQGKKEYAIKKSLESLVENMQVVNETKIDEF